jgi:hypothetical protein
VDEDIAAITSAPEGAVAYFLRSSVMHNDPLDRAIIATSRLAQGGHASASAALREIRIKWEDAVRPHTRDQASLELVMLVSDGLLQQARTAGRSRPVPPRRMDAIALVEAPGR